MTIQYLATHKRICAYPGCGKRFKAVKVTTCYCNGICDMKARNQDTHTKIPIDDDVTKNPLTAHNWTIFTNDCGGGDFL